MRSVRTKIILLALFGTLLSAVAVGAFSIQNTREQIQLDSTQIMNQVCQNTAQEIDAVISRIEQSVGTLADQAVNSLEDLNAFQTDPAYVDMYTEKMEGILLSAAQNTEGAVTAYLRYNPEFTQPTSGLFFSRDSSSSPFQKLAPTDFSIYDQTDTAHVGWYYIPVQNKAATWMSPYLNENLQVYMISYVVPLYQNGISVGVVGMDIDFTLLQQVVDQTKIYNSGYAFLADAGDSIMYHRDLAVNTSMAGLGVDALRTALQAGGQTEHLVSYQYGGTAKQMAYATLKNGMRLVLTAPLSEINASTNRLIRQIAGATVAAVTLCTLLSLFSVRGIVRPLEALNRAARRIADGELDVTVTCRTKDEIGALAGSFELTVKRLKQYIHYIEEISAVLEEIARGNLVFELRHDYVGEFARVKNALMYISQSLNQTLWQISRASDQVSSGSAQVATGAQVLSQGAAQQAAAVEELSSTIHDIAQKANQSVETARRTDALASETAQSVQESSRYMVEMTQAMGNITQASEKISQIVKTVDGIASQTNILALNAAVESARAGEAGKSFAVVASEVRALSEQVGAATKDIAELVQNAITAIDHGTAIVKKTESSLEVVKDKSASIVIQIQEMAQTSGWQAQAIEQVNQGMGQISSVVQTNSATAEESAAASEEMSGQAQILKTLIGQFRLEQQGERQGESSHPFAPV